MMQPCLIRLHIISLLALLSLLVLQHIYATSFHDGYMNQPRSFTQQAVTACAMRPPGHHTKEMMPLSDAACMPSLWSPGRLVTTPKR